MNVNNGTIVFETLLKDNCFFQYIDDYIEQTTPFDSKHIPLLLFIISNLLTTNKGYNKIMKNIKTVKDFNEFYYHISDYIVNKINKVAIRGVDYNDFIITYDTCLKLILMNHKYPKNIKPILN